MMYRVRRKLCFLQEHLSSRFKSVGEVFHRQLADMEPNARGPIEGGVQVRN